MNFLLGIVLIVIMYSGAEAFRAPIIDDFLDGCAYNSADAFQAGDEFYSIDGNRIYLISDVSMFLERGNGVYDIVMLRDGQKVEFNDMKLVPTIEASRDLNTASCGALKGRPSASNANTSGTRQRGFHALSGSASATLSTVRSALTKWQASRDRRYDERGRFLGGEHCRRGVQHAVFLGVYRH